MVQLSSVYGYGPILQLICRVAKIENFKNSPIPPLVHRARGLDYTKRTVLFISKSAIGYIFRKKVLTFITPHYCCTLYCCALLLAVSCPTTNMSTIFKKSRGVIRDVCVQWITLMELVYF